MYALRMANGSRDLAEELEGAALLGLVDAARLFDPARGLKFGTYAPRRIVGAIKDHIRQTVGLPGFRRKGAAPPTRVVCVESDGEFRDPLDLAAAPGGEPGLDGIDAVDHLTAKIHGPTRIAVRAYFTRAGATMKVIARELNLSESRVSQLITTGLGDLRERLEAPA